MLARWPYTVARYVQEHPRNARCCFCRGGTWGANPYSRTALCLLMTWLMTWCRCVHCKGGKGEELKILTLRPHHVRFLLCDHRRPVWWMPLWCHGRWLHSIDYANKVGRDLCNNERGVRSKIQGKKEMSFINTTHAIKKGGSFECKDRIASQTPSSRWNQRGEQVGKDKTQSE